MLGIDGAAGTDLVYLQKGDPGIAGELAAARACGVTAAILTGGPQGRIWLDDAAVARAEDHIAKWRETIDVHPDLLMLIETGADLDRARRERKFGQIFTFQGT